MNVDRQNFTINKMVVAEKKDNVLLARMKILTKNVVKVGSI